MERDLGSLSGGSNLRLGEETIDRVNGSQEILKILVEAKESNKAVGICSPLTDDGFVITAVEDIILTEGEMIICIKPYDVTGFMLPFNKLLLSEITAVSPLNSTFQDPVLKNLDNEKKWFF